MFDLSALLLLRIYDAVQTINERTHAMANEFDDLKREVAEQGAVTVQVLDVATQAVALINDLRAQLAQGGLTAAEAAALAADLDAQQTSLAEKLAELAVVINPTPAPAP